MAFKRLKILNKYADIYPFGNWTNQPAIYTSVLHYLCIVLNFGKCFGFGLGIVFFLSPHFLQDLYCTVTEFSVYCILFVCVCVFSSFSNEWQNNWHARQNNFYPVTLNRHVNNSQRSIFLHLKSQLFREFISVYVDTILFIFRNENVSFRWDRWFQIKINSY